MTISRQVFTTLFCGLFFCATPVLAEVGAEAKAEAKADIEEGKAFLKSEDYAGALDAFERSYALNPKTWVLFNIGMCQKALHRYADAIATFNKYLTLEKKTESSNFKTLELALQAVDELEQLVGKVNIIEAPDGAAVEIDGAPVATTPLEEPLVMDPGRHALKISKPGFQGLDIDVIVASGAEVEVRASLAQPKAKIRVDCTGSENTVLIDDNEVGACPFEGEVESGRHMVSVVSEGKTSFQNTVEAEAGSTIVMAVELKPDKPPEPPTFVERAPKGQEDAEPPSPWKRVAGITAAGLGAVMVGVGGIMTYKWNGQYDVVGAAAQETDDANTPDNYADVNLEDDIPGWQDARARYDNEVEQADGYRAGAIAGYAIGGGLLIVGGVFLVLDIVTERKEANVAVRPAPNGVAVAF